jgi:hypothetical protein
MDDAVMTVLAPPVARFSREIPAFIVEELLRRSRIFAPIGGRIKTRSVKNPQDCGLDHVALRRPAHAA